MNEGVVVVAESSGGLSLWRSVASLFYKNKINCFIPKNKKTESNGMESDCSHEGGIASGSSCFLFLIED